MQEIEKILEEINDRFENLTIADDECRKTALSKHNYEQVKYFQNAMFYTERAKGIVEEIIHKHMGNDGWIPVEERLPEVPDDMEDEYCPEFNVTIKGASRATTLKYSPAGAWFDDSGQVYVVIAWRPLPDLYRSEKGAEIETKQNGARKED